MLASPNISKSVLCDCFATTLGGSSSPRPPRTTAAVLRVHDAGDDLAADEDVREDPLQQHLEKHGERVQDPKSSAEDTC